MNYTLNNGEREYLRELATKQATLAASEENKARAVRWQRHNDCMGEKPMIMIEEETFYRTIKPENKCTSELGKYIEDGIVRVLKCEEIIGDDRVIQDTFRVSLAMTYAEYGITQEKHVSTDTTGNDLGFHLDPVIVDLEEDLSKLTHSVFSCDLDEKRILCDKVEEVIGDILPVELYNGSMLWNFGLTQKVVNLMGMQDYFFAMYDNPDELHDLMRFITDDAIAFAKWQEDEGLLTPNWDNHDAGSCSFGFTTKMPNRPMGNTDLRKGKTDIKLKDFWLNTNSQETVGISTDMFKEFAMPYYKELCTYFGAVYYGCCEPVQDLFTDGLDAIDNIRKISVSHWCDTESIGKQLQGKNIIFSRKPDANFLGTDEVFNEEAYREYIQKSVDSAKGLEMEIIHRDVYTLKGDEGRVKRALKIARECADKHQF